MEVKSIKNFRLNLTIKAGAWYTISNVLLRGFSFFTIPILTHLTTKAEYGAYTNFETWRSFLLVIVTCQFCTSLPRAQFDYKDDFDGYVSSITFLGNLITLVICGLFFVFAPTFETITGLTPFYIFLLFAYFFFQPAFQNMQTADRLKLRYKRTVILSVASTVLATIASIVCLLSFDNKILGIIFGHMFPLILICMIIYAYILYKGKCLINLTYWKYATRISVPLIIHALSHSILTQSDRIIIRYYYGDEPLAIYSLAYAISTAFWILGTSINDAWSPWLMEKLNLKKTSDIRKASKPYFMLFWLMTVGLLFMTPEVIWFMGGIKYKEAIYVMPPIIASTLVQFFYTFYVNIEIYEKKTMAISKATLMAAIINIILNFIFVPRFGYIAAAVTTLVGYIFLVVFHYNNVKKLGRAEIYDNKWHIGLLIIFGGLLISSYLLYNTYILRYFILLVIILIVCLWFWVTKSDWLKYFINAED